MILLAIACIAIILLVKLDYPSFVLKYVPYIQEVGDLLSANSMQETKWRNLLYFTFQEDWALYLMTKMRTMKLRMIEFDENYDENFAEGTNVSIIIFYY